MHSKQHFTKQENTKLEIPNWKTLDLDGIQGFWFKKFTSVHVRLVTEMNKCMQKKTKTKPEIPEWMTKGKTTLVQENPLKGTTPSNYRPIMWLPIMWKILTA